MNKKAESTKFIIILVTSLILIGLGIISFSSTPVITAKTTYSSAECYIMNNGEPISSEIVQCCAVIKRSQGCDIYKDDLFLCKGNAGALVNKETIMACK
ncbi:MAG: hypothetical protein AABW88_00465 [Nanoarchaeota archaeon]